MLFLGAVQPGFFLVLSASYMTTLTVPLQKVGGGGGGGIAVEDILLGQLISTFVVPEKKILPTRL